MNVALSGINLWFIRRLASERHSDVAFEVLEVGPLDEYLRHTMRVHAEDIERFQPGFEWDGAAPGHTAYLVQRADETVGVVLVRDAGDGVAQVELDYVTPRSATSHRGSSSIGVAGSSAIAGSARWSRPRGWLRRITTGWACAATAAPMFWTLADAQSDSAVARTLGRPSAHPDQSKNGVARLRPGDPFGPGLSVARFDADE
ncbi:MAG: hypothetical protein ACYDDW_11445 [Dermatophilaceae bacterium]